MSELLKKNNFKKEVIKDIILKLHEGLSLEEAKKEFEEKVGSITSSEIAEIEQSLINEGMAVDEIKKFCNVHALLFESSLSKIASSQESPGHPIHTFKLENRKIEELISSIKRLVDTVNQISQNNKQNDKNKTVTSSNPINYSENLKNDIKELLQELKKIEFHYVRKEQLLFPFLERYGFMGPSKVMWGKHNEIRELLKKALSNIDACTSLESLKSFISQFLNPLIEEIEGMIFKEENILFPTSLEKLKAEDWIEILKESNEVGYSFIEKPKETSQILEELKRNLIIEAKINDDGTVNFPSGLLTPNELMLILNNLPIDITFIDKDDTVKYFSDNKDRIFVRTKSVIGRKVQNCHPPQSVEAVEKILNSFKNGTRNSADFWINFKDRLIFIKFIAIRDNNSNYLGTVEITIDITDYKKIEGERRLLDEKNFS